MFSWTLQSSPTHSSSLGTLEQATGSRITTAGRNEKGETQKVAYHLRQPEDAVGRRRRERVEDGWEPGEPRDPEHRGAEKLAEAGQEADLAQIVRRQLVPRGPPLPGPLPPLVAVSVLRRFGREKRALVAVVVHAAARVRTQAQAFVPAPFFLVGGSGSRSRSSDGRLFFEGPAEAVGAVLVDGLEHQQDRPELEDGGADEGRDAAAQARLARERRGRALQGQPGEEAVDDPDDGSWRACRVRGVDTAAEPLVKIPNRTAESGKKKQEKVKYSYFTIYM